MLQVRMEITTKLRGKTPTVITYRYFHYVNIAKDAVNWCYCKIFLTYSKLKRNLLGMPHPLSCTQLFTAAFRDLKRFHYN